MPRDELPMEARNAFEYADQLEDDLRQTEEELDQVKAERDGFRGQAQSLWEENIALRAQRDWFRTEADELRPDRKPRYEVVPRST